MEGRRTKLMDKKPRGIVKEEMYAPSTRTRRGFMSANQEPKRLSDALKKGIRRDKKKEDPTKYAGITRCATGRQGKGAQDGFKK